MLEGITMSTSNIVLEYAWGWSQQELRQKMYEEEVIKKYGKQDPLEPPKRERGDIYIILGAITGAIIGGVLGSFGNLLTLFIGIIIGAIIGATAGYFIKKYIRQKPA
jgi:outer membrane lipoprotein SlyB